MTEQQIIGVCILCAFILIFPCALEGVAWSAMLDKTGEYKFLSPATLKRATKMNWVGCIFTWIALGIVSPCMFIYKCIYNLFHI